MSNNKCSLVETPWNDHARESVDCGLKDDRGRAIGYVVTRWEGDATETDATSYYNIAPGHWFFGLVQATRDGKAYGASNPTHCYRTAAEVEQRITKALSGGRRRYEKQFPRAVAR